MLASMIFGLAFVVTITLLFYRGNSILRQRENQLARVGYVDNEPLKSLGVVSYHGGFPAIPKPQKLTIGIGNTYLILMTHMGEVGKSPFISWKNIEQFSVLVKSDPKKKSMALWGPFNNVMFKDRQRHFITVKYSQPDGKENNILFEHNSEVTLQEIFDKLNSGWKQQLASSK